MDIQQKISELVHNLAPDDKFRVLFVCLGNICRSPAADGMMHAIVAEYHDEYQWAIDSAGTGDYHIGQLPDQRMRMHARRRGLDLNHRCRQVCEADFDRFDIIIPMDHSNRDNLRRIAPSIDAEAKIVPMSEFLIQEPRYDYIPDPYYEGAAGFELVLDLLTEGCDYLYRLVSAAREHKP